MLTKQPLTNKEIEGGGVFPRLFIMSHNKSNIPPLNPLTFKQLVKTEDLSVNKAQRAQRLYEVRVLKQLLPCYGMSRTAVEVYFDGKTKDPWSSIVGGSPEELRRIWVKKTAGITIGRVIRAPRDTAAFTLFKKCVNQYGYPVGVVFPVLSYGDWIMHTLGHPFDTSKGMARIIVSATSENVPDLVIETLPQFITTRKDATA